VDPGGPKAAIELGELLAAALVKPKNPVAERLARHVDRHERLPLGGDADGRDPVGVDLVGHLPNGGSSGVPPIPGGLFAP
jgi:hypothetical protein